MTRWAMRAEPPVQLCEHCGLSPWETTVMPPEFVALVAQGYRVRAFFWCWACAREAQEQRNLHAEKIKRQP